LSKNSFDINGYAVIEKAINSEICNFCFEYLNLKKKVVKQMFEDKTISPYNKLFGIWTDRQVPNTYAHYADIAMEVLLKRCKPILEKHTGLKLVENYSFLRVYKKHDSLFRHTDRPECEISCTMTLGGDVWPIFLKKKKSKKIKISLKEGDLLVYKGAEIEHWRDPFMGDNCTQVFLHYSPADKKNIESTKYDKRKFVGMPLQEGRE
tara:strand:+ start:2976 stop:3596 length:621 start_codon:yes stop_codon:yes gene_type:complete